MSDPGLNTPLKQLCHTGLFSYVESIKSDDDSLNVAAKIKGLLSPIGKAYLTWKTLPTFLSNVLNNWEPLLRNGGDSILPSETNCLRLKGGYDSAYLHDPFALRRMLHTTNGIERFNTAIRQVTRHVNSFPHSAAALNLVFMVTKQMEETIYTRPIRSFALIDTSWRRCSMISRHNFIDTTLNVSELGFFGFILIGYVYSTHQFATIPCSTALRVGISSFTSVGFVKCIDEGYTEL